MKIGVGITTRNRPDVLDMALNHFKTYSSYDIQYCIADDNSDKSNLAVIQKYGLEDSYFKSDKRLGIAKNKNVCLEHLKDCDYIFSFDDDAFPMRKGWEDLFIQTARKSKNEHLMYLTVIGDLHELARNSSLGIKMFDNCMGVCLFFTKKVVDTVGGYNKNFGTYGFEHAEYSMRAHAAGLTPNGKYLAPIEVEKYIYTIDIDYNWKKTNPPLNSINEFISSIHGEDVAGYIKENERVVNRNNPIYQEL